MNKAGFIGCGNMGGALARAAAKSIGGENILVSDKDGEKVRALCSELGTQASDNAFIAANCEYIFLGVKPQFMQELLSEIGPALTQRRDSFVPVTMAAGISTERITEMIGAPLPVIRIMPNTPCAHGAGTVLCCTNAAVNAERRTAFAKIMSCAGMLDFIPEAMMDAAAALSGCGPAYVYMFVEALADGAVHCGVPRDKALKYAAQTVLGSAETLLKTSAHPGALKDAVCSPGGTTIVGVHALEKAGFRAAAQEAVIAAYEKTLELKKQ